MSISARQKTVRSPKHIAHAIAHCNDCEWTDELSTTAPALATKHVKRTGHTVAVELGVHYNVSPHGAWHRAQPTPDGMPLQMAKHTPEMWSKIGENLPKLMFKQRHQSHNVVIRLFERPRQLTGFNAWPDNAKFCRLYCKDCKEYGEPMQTKE